MSNWMHNTNTKLELLRMKPNINLKGNKPLISVVYCYILNILIKYTTGNENDLK